MADIDTHSSSSSDGGGDVFLSPRSSVASKRSQTSVQSVPTVPEDNQHQQQPEMEPFERRSTVSRRETWIGEGLIDASGLEAIDRLSDVAYAEIVKESQAVRHAPSEDVAAAAADAKANKLSEFLTQTYPEGEAKQSTQRRRKLLDFLANDVGERYLNGVYKEEERAAGEDETGLDDLDSDDEPKFQHAEDLHTISSRSARANSRLMAFIAHEKNKRHNSDGNHSSHSAPTSTEPHNKFVTKVVPQKSKMLLFNPDDVDSNQLTQMVAEEAVRKQKARADKEIARQKVRQFLLEEEQEHAKRKGSNEATIKSVDETTVRRETVVDDYGKVNLLDYLDRVVDDGRSRNGGSVPSEMDESGPPSETSSPRSIASSLEADTSTPFTQGDDGVAPPTPSTLSGMGNRFAQFLHRNGSSNGIEDSSTTPRARRLLPPSPFHSRFAHEKMSLEAAFNASKPIEPPAAPAVYGVTTARMTPLLATLDQISHTCQKNELSEVSIARISTLLTSINQIVRDDIQKHRGQPNRVVRRLSGANWVKSEHELHEQEKPRRAPMPPSKPVPEIPREPTPVVSATATVDNANVKAGPGVLNAFKAFDAAQNLIECLSSFNKLLTECGLSGIKVDEPWRVYNHIKSAVYSKLGFRHKQLFKLLDARFNMDVYKRKPAAKKRICIIGAGPVGLRAAVETALLGGQVVVLEKRKHFSRENILHLWPWVVQDLTALGAKVFFPSFCHSTAYFHVGTRQLQVILLKVALLVGVTVYSSTAFESVISPNSEESDNKPFYTVATQPQIPWMEFTAVLGASGTNDKLAEPAGINRFVFSRKEALGIVCYFPNLGTTEEKKVTEFSWTIQFKQQMFAKMREIGVDLENIVYYRGEMHYLVMTPKRQNLLEQKVLKVNHPEPKDLVQDDNINKSTLHEYVKRVVGFLGIPKKAEFSRIRMFDFSSRTRADKAASIITSHGKKLYVGLIGDSLIEPFWPEGVGTCRGFLGALDGVWMVAQIGKKADEQLLADREMAYRVIQHVSGFRRDDLQKNVRKYTVDPKSRYTVKFPQLC
ncbi:MICAL (molecule Interacting with CasL)-like protein [Phytophthora megakarya]|uniref:MICAL (Molecule Interacting with CasL)-like protein n=1 Tax=Phytophthora megakarya TaxID=4795 RepID=A0A225VUV4_9STRA|nr:MICAL (molecule Interacting with CasL)-like protein [Phytophthora megakarya]